MQRTTTVKRFYIYLTLKEALNRAINKFNKTRVILFSLLSASLKCSVVVSTTNLQFMSNIMNRYYEGVANVNDATFLTTKRRSAFAVQLNPNTIK